MDFNRAALLLHVVDTARHWPTLNGLHDAAMKELVEISNSKNEAQDQKPKATPPIERKI